MNNKQLAKYVTYNMNIQRKDHDCNNNNNNNNNDKKFVYLHETNVKMLKGGETWEFAKACIASTTSREHCMIQLLQKH